jgi:hypothetical protein
MEIKSKQAKYSFADCFKIIIKKTPAVITAGVFLCLPVIFTRTEV